MTQKANVAFQPTPNFRAVRRRALIRVQLFNAANELQDVMVQNISSTGMRVVARLDPPAHNEVVTVHLPDSTALWGVVRWVKDKEFGVEFDVSSKVSDYGTAQSPASVPARFLTSD